MRGFFADVLSRSARIYWTLFRIAFPLLILIRALDEAFGIVALCGRFLSPLMSLTGLPGEAAVVWACALLLNLYAAMLMLAGMWGQLDLTSAQATVLATMMLVAHALPVELKIAQKAGAGLWTILAVRVLGALGLGMILNAAYSAGGFLQGPAPFFLDAAPQANGWAEWFRGELVNWALIFADCRRRCPAGARLAGHPHAERLLIRALAPLMRRMGVGDQAVVRDHDRNDPGHFIRRRAAHRSRPRRANRTAGHALRPGVFIPVPFGGGGHLGHDADWRALVWNPLRARCLRLRLHAGFLPHRPWIARKQAGADAGKVSPGGKN